MANRIFRCTNGVSLGARYTVQASDVGVDAVVGVAEKIKLTITDGATADGDVSITLRDGTPVAIAVLVADDTAAKVATKIAAGAFAGWSAAAVNEVVTFTADDKEEKTGLNVIDSGDTGVVGTFEVTVPGVTAEDAIPGEITFVFKGTGSNAVPYPLAAGIQIVNSSNVNQAASDVKISYPANGTIKIEDGSTFKLAVGQKISIVAQRADIISE